MTKALKLSKDPSLFGSRARGDHDSHSDYDLIAVVKSSKLTKFERSTKARTVIGSVNAAVDVVVLFDSHQLNLTIAFIHIIVFSIQ